MLVDGDEKAWELTECVRQYYPGTTNAITENIRFIVTTQNKIEHRYVPAIDAHVAGECQSLLLNFDELILEFGDYYAIREHLTVPLQTTTLRSTAQVEALKKYQGKNYELVKQYIDVFRHSLSDEISCDPSSSFRVFLVPKIGNHKSSSDIAFEFISTIHPETWKTVQKLVALIKEKMSVGARHNATGVITQVGMRIAYKFKSLTSSHLLLSKKIENPNTTQTIARGI